MYWLTRALATLPTLVGVSVFSFLLVHLTPGDPLTTLTEGAASEATIARLQAYYGFDQPLPVQYATWLAGVLSGDFGVSVSMGRPIAPMLGTAVLNTLAIAVPAAFLAVFGGWALGVRAALSQNRFVSRSLSFLLPALVSVPPYWLGMVMVAVFAVSLTWLPAMGMGPAGSLSGLLSPGGLQHLVLPVLTLTVATMGILARSTKAAVEHVAELDFVAAMRARGAAQNSIDRRIARNASPGLASLYGLQIAYLLGASILVESVFAWPGLGVFLTNAIQQRDIPAIQAALLVLGVAFVILNLVADMVQAYLDPRVKR